MEKLVDFTQVVDALTSSKIVYCLNPDPTYCYLKENKVITLSKQSQVVLSMDDFLTLYHKEVFYVHQRKHEDDIDLNKDIEYYELRCK